MNDKQNKICKWCGKQANRYLGSCCMRCSINNPHTELERLKFLKMQGCGNTCPKCKQTGEFGSITKWLADDNKIYLICGKCEHIHETKKGQ